MMGKKAAPRRLNDNEAMAYSRVIRTSPQTLNLIAALLRGRNAQAARDELNFSRRRVAGEVKRVLDSAIANAENNHQLDVDRLYIAEATVGRAFAMKRFRARARGRVGSITKTASNLTVVVRERGENN